MFYGLLGHHHDMLESIRSRDINRFIKVQMESRERSYRYYSEVSAEEGHTP